MREPAPRRRDFGPAGGSSPRMTTMGGANPPHPTRTFLPSSRVASASISHSSHSAIEHLSSCAIRTVAALTDGLTRTRIAAPPYGPRWKKQPPGCILKRMRRDEVIAKLKETEPALKAFGVAALYLFGSHARDEARSDSDVDVFVDPAPDRTFGPPLHGCICGHPEGIRRSGGDRLFYPNRPVALHSRRCRARGCPDF
jgi:hypothetical protein